LVADARRFILLSQDGIEIAPLQVYESALIFSPKNSLIKQAFKREQAFRVSKTPKVKEDWDACLQILELPGIYYDTIVSATFSKDNQQLFAWGRPVDGVVAFDSDSGQCLRTLSSYRKKVSLIAVSPDGDQMAAYSTDEMSINLWDIRSSDSTKVLEGLEYRVIAISFSHSGQVIASTSVEGATKIFNVQSAKCTHTLESPTDRLLSCEMAWSDADHQLLLVAEAHVYMWEVGSSTWTRTMKLDDGSVTCVALSSDGQQVASVSAANELDIKIWDLFADDCKRILKCHNGATKNLIFFRAEQKIASCSHDFVVRIWNLTDGACLRKFTNPMSAFTSLDFSNDGRRMVTGHEHGQIVIWDIDATFDNNEQIDCHGGPVRSLAWSRDGLYLAPGSKNGQRLASGSENGTVKIWEATTTTCLQTLEGHKEAILALAWSAWSSKGRCLASSTRSEIRVWGIPAGNRFSIKLKNSEVSDNQTAVALSDNGERVALCRWKFGCKVWDVKSGRSLWESNYDDTYGYNGSIAMSRDGKLVATAIRVATTGMVQVWEWNIPKRKYIRKADTNCRTPQLSYKPDNPSQLQWEEENISPGLGITKDLDWITEKGENLVWLPPRYRPNSAEKVAASERRIAIGCHSGHVFIISF
jgi:WD40 repeat protein